MKLGSLFDGSGGFPLAGAINGITPVWASEIEPYPIRVTKARFPNMRHLGSVLDVRGDKIEPVDVITFGSPCQDLSVAGKQKGIHDGERSSLFFEAVRIVKEMREHDRATGRSGVDVRPRYIVWENVPGAFSSNGGEDFRAVLEAIGGVAEDGVSVPRPEKGKWKHSGCVVGDGWSIAWRMYDAQYWGVPQRRKRIYLVADFASERGNSEESRKEGQGVADDAEGSVGGSCEAFHLQQDPICGRVSPCIGGQHQATVGVATGFKGNQGSKARSIGWEDGLAPTLNAHTPGLEPTVCYALEGNTIDRQSSKNGKGWCSDVAPTMNTQDRHGVVFPEVARTLTAEHDSSPCVDRGQNVVCFAANGNHCGDYKETDVSGTLQTRYHFGGGGDGAAVVYDCRGNGDGKHVPTLTGEHGNRVTDYTAVCVGNGQLHQMSMADQANTIDCMHDQQAILMQGKHPRKYIVRRLTPLECCRLQGFPDWWEDGVEGRDSARYKMWGNGIALPCAVDVLRRIAQEAKT